MHHKIYILMKYIPLKDEKSNCKDPQNTLNDNYIIFVSPFRNLS